MQSEETELQNTIDNAQRRRQLQLQTRISKLQRKLKDRITPQVNFFQ